MRKGRRKNPENRTAREEIASVIDWAERQGFADVPAIRALHQPTQDTVLSLAGGPCG
jgi:predicted transcriptional regulator